MSPRDRSPMRTPSPRQPSGKYIPIWLCCSCNKLLVLLVRGELPPPDWAWFLPRFFFSILSPMEFWFLAAVASGLFGCFISSNIVDFIAKILFKLNWAGWFHHWIPIMKFLQLKLECLILSFYIINTIFLFWYCTVALTQFVLFKSAI